MHAYPVGNGVLTARVPREFAAAIEALQLPAPNTDALVELSDAEWRKLLNICDLAHLTLSLAQLPSRGFPAWVVERLQRNVADNTLRAKCVQALYTEAAAALERARVPHLVIKGFTLSPDYVRDARFRVQNDLDFYVPPHHIDTAVAALQSLGYSSALDCHCELADHVPSLVRPGGEWKGNMYDPDLALGIELHFCLWNSANSRISLPEVEFFWRRRVQRRFGAFSFWSLGDVDQFGYFALHVLRDVFAGDWIAHHVLELATFLDRRACDTAFWSRWQKLHSPHLRQIEAVAFLIAHTWFSARLSEEVRDEIAALPAALTRWVESLGGCPLEASYRKTREGRLLQFLLADSWDSKLHALRHALLPSVFTIPSGSELHVRNRRFRAPSLNRYYLDRIAWLSHRLRAHLQADASFLVHGIRYWLSTRAPFAEDRLLRTTDGIKTQYAVDAPGR
jgi:hypothetical protein